MALPYGHKSFKTGLTV